MSTEESRMNTDEIILFANLLYERKYSVGTEGNISIRTDRDSVIITPSNMIKKFITPDDLVETDFDGKVIRGSRKPSTEISTHLALYRGNTETKAVIHAHPPFTILVTLSGDNPFTNPVLAESALFLCDTTVLPFARPSTGEGAERIRDHAHRKVIVIANHGSFTHGKDLTEAFALLETLEKCAMIDYYAKYAGIEAAPLSEEQLSAIGKIEYGK